MSSSGFLRALCIASSARLGASDSPVLMRVMPPCFMMVLKWVGVERVSIMFFIRLARVCSVIFVVSVLGR